MRPADHRFFLKEDEKPTQTSGGLYLVPTSQKQHTLTGTVTEVGGKVEYVKPGDRVTFHKKDSKKLDNGLWSILENPDRILICD